jgi:hypothetical protein
MIDCSLYWIHHSGSWFLLVQCQILLMSQSPVSNVKSPTQTSSGKPSQSATTTSQNLSSGNSLPQNTPNAPSQLPVNGSSSQPPVKDQSQPPVNDQSQPPVNSQKQHQHSRQNHHSGILNLTGIGPTILFRSDTCNLKPRLFSTSSSRC